MPKVTQCRRFTFTWNNRTKEDVLRVIDRYGDKISYMVAAEEVAPTTGTPHIQGYMELKKKTTPTSAQNYFGRTVALIISKGSAMDNLEYCSKADAEPLVYGEPMRPGGRTDIHEFKEAIAQGSRWRDLADTHGSMLIKYPNGARLLKGIVEKESRKAWRDVTVTVLYGPTGTGKTRTAMDHDDVYKISPPYDWFDGYDGEQILVIDEYDSQIPITRLLGILDGYQLRLPIKGGFTYAAWTRVIITSNISPYHWHEKAKDEHRQALDRRLTDVVRVEGQ